MGTAQHYLHKQMTDFKIIIKNSYIDHTHKHNVNGNYNIGVQNESEFSSVPN